VRQGLEFQPTAGHRKIDAILARIGHRIVAQLAFHHLQVAGTVTAGRIRESALAMGMTRQQILWRVEIPLALPTILAGLRIAIVSTIGTATIAAAIGGGGLGTFMFRGIATADLTTVLAGAIPAAVMAIIADEVLEWAERRYSV